MRQAVRLETTELTGLCSMGGTDKAKEWIEKYHDKAEAAGVAVGLSPPLVSHPLMTDCLR